MWLALSAIRSIRSHTSRVVLSVLVTPVLMFSCSAILTDVRTASILSLFYTVTLCALLYATRKWVSVGLITGCAFASWLAVAVIINLRTPPVTIHDVRIWLKNELKTGAGRSDVISFVSRHMVFPQTMNSFVEGKYSYIVVTYTNSHYFFACPPSVRIIFELTHANRLADYQVDEELNCS